MKSKILAIIGIFLNCTVAVADEKELTAEEQKALYNGTTHHYIMDNGWNVNIDYNANGTMSGMHDSGATDEGVWYIKGNLYCRQWNDWANNDVDCHKNFHLGEGWYKSVRESDGQIVKFEIVRD